MTYDVQKSRCLISHPFCFRTAEVLLFCCAVVYSFFVFLFFCFLLKSSFYKMPRFKWTPMFRNVCLSWNIRFLSLCIGHRACKWWRQKPSNAWQRGKLVLNKDCVPYQNMLGDRQVARWLKLFNLFYRGLKGFDNSFIALFVPYEEISGIGRAVLGSIDDFPACFFMEPCLCSEPILPVATPIAALWRSTRKPYYLRLSERHQVPTSKNS